MLIGKKLVRVAPSADALRKGAVQAGISSSMIAAEHALCSNWVLQRQQNTISRRSTGG
jgi:hypothetical protein